MLNSFPYIILPEFSQDFIANIEALFRTNNKANTFAHVKAVAEMNIKIAEQYGLEKEICEKSGWLHDISAVVAPADMLKYAVEKGWYIDESEMKYPFLLHQRISKIIAEQDFGITDERILSAIECHSTLKANPSPYDMALFIADKLAWDKEGEAPFYKAVSEALRNSLEAASLAYMDYIVEHKMILHPHKWFNEGVNFLRKDFNQITVRKNQK